MKGRHKAAILLLESGLFEASEINFQLIEYEGSSILKPNKSRVGVSLVEYVWSQNEIEDVAESDNYINTIDDMVPIPANQIDPIVMVEGKPYHKASIICQKLMTERVSIDRLKFICGFSKFDPIHIGSEGSLSKTLFGWESSVHTG